VVVEVEVEVEKALTGGLAKEAERYGGTLRITTQGSLSQLDPYALKGAAEASVAQHMWSPTFDIDKTKNVQPMLVESWSASDDSLVWTINLRSGQTFQDGSPIRSDDAIASLLRWFDSRGPGGRTLKGFLTEDPLTKVNDLTFTITHSEVFGSTLDALGGAGQPNWIFPKDIGEIDPTIDMYSVNENNLKRGSGPYQLNEWMRGDHVSLVRYDDYEPRTEPTSWRTGRQSQYVDELMFIEVPAEETKLAGLKTGIFDVMEVAGLDSYDILNDHPDIKIHMGDPKISGLFFNLHDAESIMTKDVKIRQALNAGINVPDFMYALGPKGLWWECSALYGHCQGEKWKWETQIADPIYSQNDIPLAKELLADSSYNGEVVHIMAPTDYATITPLGQVLLPLMLKIGFNAEMPAINWANLLSRLGAEDWDIFTSWTGYRLSPLDDGEIDLVYAWMRDWPNRQQVEWKAEFLRETDHDKKMALVEKIQYFYHDQLPFKLMGHFAAPDGYRNNIHGLGVEQENVKSLYYGNVWIEK
jgi:peptide/nickel transport system substrate-binding protein